MSYLITGGCGFVGSNLAADLLAQGRNVTVFDNLGRNGAEANLQWLRAQGPVEFIHGDTRNAFDVEGVVRQKVWEGVFHLAGQVAMTTSMQSPRRDFEINVLGSVNLLEAVRAYAPETPIVYASSNKVYGNLAHLDLVEKPTRYEPTAGALGVDESAPLEFHTPYGCSKGAADQYMLDYARVFGLKTVVFRHSTIYGGRQFATFDQGWVGWFCRQAIEIKRDASRNIRRKQFTICGDGKQVRDLLHVSDAVRCYLAAISHIGQGSGKAFNIGGGAENSMSLLELFAFLEERLGIRMEYEMLPWRRSDQKYFVADHRYASSVLEWEPQMKNAAGIDTVLAWEREVVG
jgi:CDP-paratose 2-epimerase